MENVSYIVACLIDVNQDVIFHSKIPHFIDYSKTSEENSTLLPDVMCINRGSGFYIIQSLE